MFHSQHQNPNLQHEPNHQYTAHDATQSTHDFTNAGFGAQQNPLLRFRNVVSSFKIPHQGRDG